MTDPIADMLTRIRNANIAMHDEVSMPSSKLNTALADVMVSEGYLAGYAVSDNDHGPGKVLTGIVTHQEWLPTLLAAAGESDIVEKLALGNAEKCHTLNELLARSDVVSVHVDGRPGNRNLFGNLHGLAPRRVKRR